MENNQKVSLGCGTLIIIAIIVMIFSNKPKIDVEVTSRLVRIETQIGALQNQVRDLQESIDKLAIEIRKK